MNINAFYSFSLNDRLELVSRSGEYIRSISFYGYKVSLYIYSGTYIEIYRNKYNNSLAEIELLDPKDHRLNQYAVFVNLSDLYRKKT